MLQKIQPAKHSKMWIMSSTIQLRLPSCITQIFIENLFESHTYVHVQYIPALGNPQDDLAGFAGFFIYFH